MQQLCTISTDNDSLRIVNHLAPQGTPAEADVELGGSCVITLGNGRRVVIGILEADIPNRNVDNPVTPGTATGAPPPLPTNSPVPDPAHARAIARENARRML